MAKAKKDSPTTPPTPDNADKAKKPSAAAKPAPAIQTATPAAEAKPAAAKSAGKKQPTAAKAGSSASKPALPTSAPLIDTDLAASSAASMVRNRSSLGATGAAPKPESAGFRQLKESLAKPAGNHLGGILGTGPIAQKKSTSHGPDKQVGRNQTFGADVNRASVPRRTGGG